jgi:hypothetical protein
MQHSERKATKYKFVDLGIVRKLLLELLQPQTKILMIIIPILLLDGLKAKNEKTSSPDRVV